ncbi:BON domain-containing protein [Myxococcaceae bacterium GXIMD 01537]
MGSRRNDEPRRYEGHGRPGDEPRPRHGPREGREPPSRAGREYARGEGPPHEEWERRAPRGLQGRPGPGPREPPQAFVERRLRREELDQQVRAPHVYDPRYGPVYGHGPGVENMPPPSIGYSTSPSRRDDHDLGHGGYLGGPRVGRGLGRGPKGYVRSDERIHEDICERLLHSWLDVEDVEVRVKQGEVTLVGSVRTRDEKHSIEDEAASVLGVKDVHNQLRVPRPSGRDELEARRPPPEDALHS